MRFGSVPLREAVGATVAHAVQADGIALKKGEIVRLEHVARLAAAGVRDLTVARLDPGDVGENEAAQVIAETVAGSTVRVERAFTGRANLFARVNGVLIVDAGAVDRVNAVDEALTLATLPPLRAVQAGEMIATVKIIPFAVPQTLLAEAVRRAELSRIAVRPFQPLRVAVLSTLLPGLKAATVRKTVGHLADRLAPAGAPIVADETLPHEQDGLAARLRAVAPLCDILVVFGASAIADRRDVVPAALVAAGGAIEQFGMPVDPGNLLLLGRLGATTVIGAPGCARSPRENGFDWVLQRLLAGIAVNRDDLRRLGAGGLLIEIGTRPQPRVEARPTAKPAPAPKGLDGEAARDARA